MGFLKGGSAALFNTQSYCTHTILVKNDAYSVSFMGLQRKSIGKPLDRVSLGQTVSQTVWPPFLIF